MTKNIASALIAAALTAWQGMAQTPAAPASDFAAAQKQFASLCEGCHGEGGNGGDRAPALVNNRSLRTRNEAQIRDLIKSGTPGGMPVFKLPEGELQALARWLRSLNVSALDTRPSGDAQAGEEFFFGKGQCSTCHMVHGRGKVNRPDLVHDHLSGHVAEFCLPPPLDSFRIGSKFRCMRSTPIAIASTSARLLERFASSG